MEVKAGFSLHTHYKAGRGRLWKVRIGVLEGSRETTPMAGSTVSCVCWEWQRDDGGFSPYLPDDSKTIEAAYDALIDSHDLGTYTVDFGKMMQRNNTSGGLSCLSALLSSMQIAV